MSTFAIIMFALTAFFAYQIYRHVQTLEDPVEGISTPATPKPTSSISTESLIEEADEAYGEGELERARDKLRRAVTLDENNPEILNKLGFIEAKLGNSNESIVCYERSLEVDPSDDLTHNAIASVYKTQGDFERAQHHYEKALDIDDAYAITYYNYGNLLSDLGENLRAQEMYAKALAIDEEFDEAREALESLRGKE